MQNIGGILKDHALAKLIQPDNFVGWVYGIGYDRAFVMTNDLWKANALGIPHNCFLIAASFKPDEFQKAKLADQEVLLLRVIGSAKLPQDDDLVRTRVDFFQQQTQKFDTRAYDDITQNQMQFGGLECRILGTFYVNAMGELCLGSDIESFAMAARLNVYRPRGDSLNTIVNHVDPLRRKAAAAEAAALGLKKPIEPFQIGTVRYTSTDRLHRAGAAEKVPVRVQPSDFLARRTAVLGMTRTGKSNMVKQMVSVVKRVADNGGVKIGQIIYDINGEYANVNQQDQGALADIFPAETVRYRMLQTKGFLELQNNFYVQLAEGFSLIRHVLADSNTKSSAADMGVFLNMSLDEPDAHEKSDHQRWTVKVAAYRTLLYRAGFPAPPKLVVKFEANQDVRNAVTSQDDSLKNKNPANGLTLDEAVRWFLAVREANLQTELKSTSGKPWLHEETKAILNMLAQKNDSDAFIVGHKILADAQRYHSPRRDAEVGDEIYKYLQEGKIIILDLSVGDPTIRERISKQIAQAIFSKSMKRFIEGHQPPNIVVYIEEAHNLLGKKMDLIETWPRLAKEGAKYKIGLVYATQEVSSVHPNILANTENWFITHLNNETEIRELAKFYDFDDFSLSLMRAQDVGFARVKTLSSPYVVPVQIDKFEPTTAKVAS